MRGDGVEGLHFRVMRLLLKRECGEVAADTIAKFLGGSGLTRIELEDSGECVETRLQRPFQKVVRIIDSYEIAIFYDQGLGKARSLDRIADRQQAIDRLGRNVDESD